MNIEEEKPMCFRLSLTNYPVQD